MNKYIYLSNWVNDDNQGFSVEKPKLIISLKMWRSENENHFLSIE